MESHQECLQLPFKAPFSPLLRFYRACIDEDGPLAQGFVDAGAPIYVTGVTAITPSGVARATNQQQMPQDSKIKPILGRNATKIL